MLWQAISRKLCGVSCSRRWSKCRAHLWQGMQEFAVFAVGANFAVQQVVANAVRDCARGSAAEIRTATAIVVVSVVVIAVVAVILVTLKFGEYGVVKFAFGMAIRATTRLDI